MNVVAIGGTTLTTNSSTGAWVSEAGWGNSTTSYANGGSGGGISKYISQPSWQTGIVTQSTTKRTLPDVSLDADPNSGVPVYDVYDNGSAKPWDQYGGTSLASPMWAGLIAITNQLRVTAGLTTLDGPSQTLPKLYSLPSTDFHDIPPATMATPPPRVTIWSPGRGSPIVNLLIPDLVGAPIVPTPAVASLTVSPTSTYIGGAITITASGVSETGGTVSNVKFYRESNGTTGLQIGSDTLVGTGVINGTTATLSTTAAGFTAGTITLYAIANDTTNSTSSAVVSTTLAVTTVPTPVIGAFAINPTSVITGAGTSITLTATGVTESGGTVANVNFYREPRNDRPANGSRFTCRHWNASGSTYTLTGVSTSGLAIGNYTFYAIAIDTTNASNATTSAVLAVTSASTTGVLLGWDTSTQSGFGTQNLTAGTIASGVTNSTGLTRGSGVSTSGSAAATAWGGANWSTTTSAVGITGNQFVTFGLTVSSSYMASLSSIDLNYRRSGTGPANGYWQYQVNGGTWGLIGDYTNEFSVSTSGGSSITEISLTSITALQNLPAGSVVNVRVTPYGASGSGGTWYVNGPTTGNDLKLNGTVSAVITSSPLVLAGPANYLEADGTGYLNVYNALTDTGTIAQHLLLTSISAISYAGTSVSDTLIIDFSHGNPLISTGLSYNGGSGGTNTLKVIGTSANDTVSLNASTVSFSSSFGTLPIAYTNTSSIILDTGAGTDSITQTAQPAATFTLDDPTINDTVTIQAGTFVLPASTGTTVNPISLNALHINSGATVTLSTAASHSGRSVLVLNTLDDNGVLSLNDNDVMVHNGSYAGIMSTIIAGKITSTAGTDPITTLAVASNVALGTFDSQTEVATDVLLKYTYFGDADIDGTVTGNDYTMIDNSFGSTTTGWQNGDFNYDGTIDGSDYSLIDNAFNTQDGSLWRELLSNSN